jgi:hypothetical protein
MRGYRLSGPRARHSVGLVGRLLFLVACLAIGRAVQSSTQVGVWPELDLWFPLGERTRLLLTASGTHDTETGDSAAGVGGIFLDFKANPDVSYGAGYKYLAGVSQSGVRKSPEHRVEFDFTYRWPIASDTRLSDRTRIDLRDIDGSTMYRLRNRLRLDKDLRFRHLMPTPYASLEAFYDSYFNKVSRFRFELGTTIPTGTKLAWDFYLVRQRDLYPKTQFVNAIGITLNVQF